MTTVTEITEIRTRIGQEYDWDDRESLGRQG